MPTLPLAMTVACYCVAAAFAESARKSVLMIAVWSKALQLCVVIAAVLVDFVDGATALIWMRLQVDDLRTQLSIYAEGGSVMHTPNFERIAKKSVVFERAYVQVALCMPSRTSLLTGRRPDTSRSWTIERDQWFRDSGGNWTTLPQHFKESGYLTIGMGKIYHETMPPGNEQDYKYAWSPEAVYPDGGQRGQGGLYDPAGKGSELAKGAAAYKFDDSYEPMLQDGNLTSHAVEVVGKLADGSYGADVANATRPFFLAIGFHKPHVPWWAPQRFWDYYPLEKVPPTPHPHLVTNNYAGALQDWQAVGMCNAPDMKSFCEPLTAGPLGYPLDNTTFPAAARQYSRQAYFAAVSWTDSNIGKVLDAFEETTFAEDAVVVLWGDHGWQLGDNDQWDKMTNFEHATKIPLMIGCGGNRCVGRSPALVEALDIMPTLLEEAGLPVPTCPTSQKASRATVLCTEGRSLSKLLRDPTGPELASFSASYSQFPRPEHPGRMIDLDCRSKNLTKSCADGFCTDGCPNKMGYTVRVDQYRYTEWVGFNKCQNSSCPAALADWDTVYGIELYNHTDKPVPDSYYMETINIAAEPQSKEIVKQLHAQLKAFNTRY